MCVGESTTPDNPSDGLTQTSKCPVNSWSQMVVGGRTLNGNLAIEIVSEMAPTFNKLFHKHYCIELHSLFNLELSHHIQVKVNPHAPVNISKWIVVLPQILKKSAFTFF